VHSISWIGHSILWQSKFEAVILSLLLEEHVNLGLVEENIIALREILNPLCIKLDFEE